jgi:5-methyltetrahydrofolate--homocysteine methyltransferase
VETNTFSGTTIAQTEYQLQDPALVYRINFESARLAREACAEFTLATGVPRYGFRFCCSFASMPSPF